MDISEIDLLRKFIEEKNLLSQYQEWRKSYVKDYENVVVKFCCLNGKYGNYNCQKTITLFH